MKILAFLITLVINPLTRGFVIMMAWNWYIVDTFSMQPLTLMQAFGLGLVVSALTFKYDDPEEDFDGWKLILKMLFYNAIVLFTLWIYHFFI